MPNPELFFVGFDELGNSFLTRFHASFSILYMYTTPKFNESTSKLYHMIGEKIPGSIEKVSFEPYEYEVPGSDEVVTLDFTYQFVSEGSKFSSPVITNQLHTDAEVFSKNGKHELVED